MNTLRILYHLARADFLERTRQNKFILILAGTVYLGYAVVVGEVKVLRFGSFRGIYNSAWVGLMMALAAAFFVSLLGFYVVKDVVDRDLQTRVGQILATARIDNLDYVLGKTLSNFAVLSAFLPILCGVGVFAQLWLGEDPHVRLWPLLSPFLLFALPAFAFVAALAVFFETVPFLRGGFGNIVYFFLWTLLLAFGIELHNGFGDLIGADCLSSIMQPVLIARLPNYRGGMSMIMFERPTIDTFVWSGLDWQLRLVSMRVYWFGLALGLVLLAAMVFDRFDPACRFFNTHSLASRPVRWRTTALQREPDQERRGASELFGSSGAIALMAQVSLTPLEQGSAHFCFGPALFAELRLMLSRLRWWWYGGTVALLIASMINPMQIVRELILPLVWLWPILLWSSLGTREIRHGTDKFFFSMPSLLYRQFPAAWLAGVIVCLMMGSGVALHLLLAHDWIGVEGFAVSALFIPTMALAMGVWAGTPKFFEVVYVIWWYMGPIRHFLSDFMFTSSKTMSTSTLLAYLTATVALFGIALLGRKRQIEP